MQQLVEMDNGVVIVQVVNGRRINLHWVVECFQKYLSTLAPCSRFIAFKGVYFHCQILVLLCKFLYFLMQTFVNIVTGFIISHLLLEVLDLIGQLQNLGVLLCILRPLLLHLLFYLFVLL